jgi:hypothetical protein
MASECKHVWRPEYMEYGSYKGRGKDRYQDTLQMNVCKKCGDRQSVSDRYFGRDRTPGYRVYFDSEGRQL